MQAARMLCLAAIFAVVMTTGLQAAIRADWEGHLNQEDVAPTCAAESKRASALVSLNLLDEATANLSLSWSARRLSSASNRLTIFGGFYGGAYGDPAPILYDEPLSGETKGSDAFASPDLLAALRDSDPANVYALLRTTACPNGAVGGHISGRGQK